MSAGRPLTGSAVARSGLALSLLVATLVRLPHLRFVPIWDGRTYWDDCAARALSNPFDPFAFNCFGHRSMLYMLTVSWPQYFDRGSALLLNLAHLGVALLTVWAFYRVVVRLMPPGGDAARGIGAGLATVVFACVPAWTAASLNLNPDTGVLAAFLFALSFLLGRRLSAAIAAGFFLVLSKEIGLLLWMVLAGVETAQAVHESGRGRAIRELLRRWGFVLPVVAYLVVGMRLSAEGRPSTWTAGAPQSTIIRTFLTFDLTDRVFAAYVADLTVLNFAWVMTLVLVIWLCAVLAAMHRQQPVPLAPEVDRRAAFLTGVSGLAALYLCTRYPTFNNVRYLLPAIAVMVIAFAVATLSVVRRPVWRTAIFTVAALLQLGSMWRTVDPLSKAAYGTFPFGEHEMLRMTSLTGECCGYGRDQLVYNLQFTAFDSVQNDLFRRLRPGNNDVFAMSGLARWFILRQLDATTHERTLRAWGTVQPQEVTVPQLAAARALPARMRYIAYPNVPNGPEIILLSHAYRVAGPFYAEDGGYRIGWYDLVLAPPAGR